MKPLRLNSLRTGGEEARSAADGFSLSSRASGALRLRYTVAGVWDFAGRVAHVNFDIPEFLGNRHGLFQQRPDIDSCGDDEAIHRRPGTVWRFAYPGGDAFQQPFDHAQVEFLIGDDC